MGAPLIARRQNIMTAYGTTNQSAGPNTTINLNSSIASGNKLKLLNNAIVIGPGISKVKVTGNIFYQDFPYDNMNRINESRVAVHTHTHTHTHTLIV